MKNQMWKIFEGPRALVTLDKNKKRFYETQNLKSLYSKNLTHKIWVKSVTIFSPKGGPFGIILIVTNHQMVPSLNWEKKFSDSTQILCVKSFGHKNGMFQISSKSGTGFFFHFQRGDPLMFIWFSRYQFDNVDGHLQT